jgi:hypothetical protein
MLSWEKPEGEDTLTRDRRFDNRSKDTFKKDIKFATMLEGYFFSEWIERAANTSSVILESWGDNGVNNDGEFIESGNSTMGADFKVSMFYKDKHYNNLPLEMKWVPTAGKFTLKKNDLRAYQKENAAILFVYNTKNCGLDMRKPRDYNLEKHVSKIEGKAKDIKWGIMFPEMVTEILGLTNRFKKIQYMGWKEGIVIQSNEFDKFFDQHNWEV